MDTYYLVHVTRWWVFYKRTVLFSAVPDRKAYL